MFAVAETARVLAQLAHYVAQEGSGLPLATRMCRACATILGAGGGALTLAYNDPERVRLGATDEKAAQLDDLQEVTGEGPSHEAYRTGQWVEATVGDRDSSPSGSSRWPMFEAAVSESLGACVIYAIPVLPRTRTLGVLTLYQMVKRPLLLDQKEAMILVDAVGVALVNGTPADPGLTVEPASWPVRAKMHQATGMVMAQLFVSPEDALALLRAHAFAHDTTLAQVSELVVSRRLDFTSTDLEPGGETP
jgi:hypothetical protein